MALAQVVSGNRILASDLNAYYNLLKGVAASGEAVTLIFNAAGSLIFQPSSDPATGTELIQIKNNAGTVQSALSSDGKAYFADGVVGTPGVTFEADKDTGIYRSTTNTLDFAAGGTQALELTATVALFKDGAIGAPGLSFISDTDTGIYRESANVFTAVAGGHAVMRWTDVGASAVNFLSIKNSVSTVGVGIEANGTDTDVDVYLTPKGAGLIDARYAVTALGAGAAPTFGTIGGAGPAVAGQNSWLKIKINGTNSFLPVWR